MPFEQGEQIGLTGATGNAYGTLKEGKTWRQHVHINVYKNNTGKYDVLNNEDYMKTNNKNQLNK